MEEEQSFFDRMERRDDEDDDQARQRVQALLEGLDSQIAELKSKAQSEIAEE